MTELPPDDVLERLSVELEAALRAGREVDASEVAARCGVGRAVVEGCLVGLRAFDPVPPSLRQVLAQGRYEYRGLLARGGMGEVYRGYDLRLEREVAIKVLRAGSFATETQRTRFLREARAAAKLTHANSIRIFDLGSADQDLYLVMELVEGARTFDQVAPTLSWRGRVSALRDASRALGEAHARGLMHRDVKPANLLVDVQGTIRVVDFGLARPLDAETLTTTGAILGTMGYLAPEQARGQTKLQGPATDVWSLGVVLFEALVGTRPFPGTSHEFIAALAAGIRAPSLLERAPTLPSALAAACAKALEHAPADRYPDGDALAEALERVLTPPRAAGLPRAQVGVLCGGSFLLGGALALATWGASSPRSNKDPEHLLDSPAPVTSGLTAGAGTGATPSAQGREKNAPIQRVMHVAAIAPVKVAFAPDGSLVTYGLSGLRRWALATGEPLGKWLPGKVELAVGLPGGEWIFQTSRVLVRRAILNRGLPASAEPRVDWTVPTTEPLIGAATSSKRIVVLASDSLGVCTLHAADGELIVVEPPRPGEPIRGLAFLDESRFVVLRTAQGTSTLSLRDTTRPSPLQEIQGAPISALSASPDGKTLAVGYSSGRVALLDAASLTPLRTLTDPRTGSSEQLFRGSVGALAFALSGEDLIAAPGPDTSSADRRVKRVVLSSGAATSLTPPLDSAPTDLAIAPGGDSFAIGREDGWAELWALPPAE